MTAEASTFHPPARSRTRRLFEWFWRGDALRRARGFEAEQPAVERSRLRHAQAAAELAARVVDGTDPLRPEPAYWLATSLYREASYWALLAESEALHHESLAGAFAESSREALLFAADGEEGLAAVRHVLLEKDSAKSAEQDVDAQHTDAIVARRFAEALIRYRLRAVEGAGRVLVQRWVRTGAACVVSLSILLAAVAAIRHATRPIDLAEGKPWRTSSSLGECRPAQNSCLGARTNILFHTAVEAQPWFEVDLGENRSFSAVEIENRGDCCPDVALPLVLEVSEDANQWKELARRTEPFDTWRAEFPPETARYVRTRAARTTALHLVRVSVYEL